MKQVFFWVLAVFSGNLCGRWNFPCDPVILS